MTMKYDPNNEQQHDHGSICVCGICLTGEQTKMVRASLDNSKRLGLSACEAGDQLATVLYYNIKLPLIAARSIADEIVNDEYLHIN